MPTKSISPSAEQQSPHQVDPEKSTPRQTDTGSELADSHESFLHRQTVLARLDAFAEKLVKIESTLSTLAQQRTVKEWYTTTEVAAILTRAEYTVREWCRQHRIRAKKKTCGRGRGGEWLVSHEELTRIKNEGILPLDRHS